MVLAGAVSFGTCFIERAFLSWELENCMPSQQYCFRSREALPYMRVSVSAYDSDFVTGCGIDDNGLKMGYV